jgi:hypothetical protein
LTPIRLPPTLKKNIFMLGRISYPLQRRHSDFGEVAAGQKLIVNACPHGFPLFTSRTFFYTVRHLSIIFFTPAGSKIPWASISISDCPVLDMPILPALVRRWSGPWWIWIFRMSWRSTSLYVSETKDGREIFSDWNKEGPRICDASTVILRKDSFWLTIAHNGFSPPFFVSNRYQLNLGAKACLWIATLGGVFVFDDILLLQLSSV